MVDMKKVREQEKILATSTHDLSHKLHEMLSCGETDLAGHLLEGTAKGLSFARPQRLKRSRRLPALNCLMGFIPPCSTMLRCRRADRSRSPTSSSSSASFRKVSRPSTANRYAKRSKRSWRKPRRFKRSSRYSSTPTRRTIPGLLQLPCTELPP